LRKSKLIPARIFILSLLDDLGVLRALLVKLPYLPLPFLTPAYLKGLVGTFGRFLRADDRTPALAHPMFARVCVEMDVSQPLPSRVWVGPSKEE